MSCLHLVHFVVVHLFVSLEHCAGSVWRMHVNLLLVLGVIILIIIRGNTDTKLLEDKRR